MITGKMSARERHREKEFDRVSVLNDPHMEAISKILDGTIASNQAARIKSVNELKSKLAMARESIKQRRPIHGVIETYACVFCRVSTYSVICNSLGSTAHNNCYKVASSHPTQCYAGRR